MNQALSTQRFTSVLNYRSTERYVKWSIQRAYSFMPPTSIYSLIDHRQKQLYARMYVNIMCTIDRPSGVILSWFWHQWNLKIILKSCCNNRYMYKKQIDLYDVFLNCQCNFNWTTWKKSMCGQVQLITKCVYPYLLLLLCATWFTRSHTLWWRHRVFFFHGVLVPVVFVIPMGLLLLCASTSFHFSFMILSMSHIPVSIIIISLGIDGGVWSIILSVLFSIFVSVPLRPLLVSMFLLRAVVWVWCMFLLVSIWFSFLFG